MNRVNFVVGWKETVEISINSAKSWLAIDRGCKFALITDYIYVKKEHSVVFLIFYSKRYVDMTKI